MAESATDKHVFGLDLVRVGAAGLVALLHFTFEYRPLAFVPPVGWVGVEIFFVLSGFVIAASLTGASPRRFVTNRLLRLYPTAWGCTFAGAAAVLLFSGTHEVVGDLATLDPRSFIDSLGLFGGRFLSSAYWTLQIELAFYGFCLLYFVLCPHRDVSRLARILIVWSAPYLVLLTLANGDVFDAPWLEFGNGFRNATLLRHGPLFALGMLLWQAVQAGGPRPDNRAWLAAAAILSGGEIVCRSLELAPRSLTGIASPLLAAMALGTWGLACLAILASIRWNEHFPRHARLRAATRTLGLMTFPFYLVHQAVGGSVMGALILQGCADATALAAGLIASLAVAWLILRFWDPAARDAIGWIGERISHAVERRSRRRANRAATR